MRFFHVNVCRVEQEFKQMERGNGNNGDNTFVIKCADISGSKFSTLVKADSLSDLRCILIYLPTPIYRLAG